MIKAGQTYDHPVISLDIFATVANYAKASPKNKLDGVNILPFLNGKKKEGPHEYLFWRKFDEQKMKKPKNAVIDTTSHLRKK